MRGKANARLKYSFPIKLSLFVGHWVHRSLHVLDHRSNVCFQFSHQGCALIICSLSHVVPQEKYDTSIFYGAIVDSSDFKEDDVFNY